MAKGKHPEGGASLKCIELPPFSMPGELELLRQAKANFELFLATTPDFVYFKDRLHRFTYASNAFAQLTGFDNWHQLIGKTDFDIFAEDHAKLYFDSEREVIQQGKTLTELEEPYYDTEQQLCWVSSSKRPLRDEDGEVIGLFGISRDITRVKKLEAEIKYRDLHDRLTDLPNRYFYEQHAAAFIKQYDDAERIPAVMCINLDNFRELNDEHGTDVGNAVLKILARRLRATLRNRDLLCRFDSDEFVALVSPFRKRVGLDVIAQRFLLACSKPVVFRHHIVRVTCSVGIALCHRDALTAEGLLSSASTALTQAKQQGKNSYVGD